MAEQQVDTAGDRIADRDQIVDRAIAKIGVIDDGLDLAPMVAVAAAAQPSIDVPVVVVGDSFALATVTPGLNKG